jgi:hypothetical protein
MPTELEGFESPSSLLEYRSIRAGERPEGGAPKKTPLRVRFPIKNLETHKYDPDVDVMKRAAERLGLPVDEYLSVREAPVMLYTDKVEGEDGVIYLERAWYAGHRRRCGSAAHMAKAECNVDIGEYTRNKKVVWLQKSRPIDCTSKCPMWVKPEDRGTKKEECRWRVIVTVQLLDSPIYPSPTRYRVSGVNTIKTMITSLNHISSVTGGILAGIPLWLRQGWKDVHDAKGKFRRIPVVTFDFKGTIQELRDHAYQELLSRQRLIQAREGKWPTDLPAPKYIGQDLDIDEIDADADDDVAPEEIEKQQVIEVSSDIALLAKKLNFTRARMEALENKHHGDIDAVLAELKTLASGSKFNPAPGEPGAEEEDEQPEPAQSNGEWDDGMFDM